MKGQTESNVIKNAVKVIIDNLVPESCKVLIFANRHQLKATDKQLETLRTSSKYKFEELMKLNEFGIIEEMYTKVGITKNQRPFVQSFCIQLTEVRKLYEGIIYDLLNLKRRIFQAMKEFQKANKIITQVLELEQIGKFIE